MRGRENKGNKAWQILKNRNEKLYVKCPPLMYRQIEKILGDSRYDLFHFRDHHSLVQLIKGSTEKFRPKRIIYHFTDVSFDRGRIDTRYITRDLRRLIPRLYILGIYRSNEDTEKILLSNGVSHALKHSSRRGSEFEQSLQELLL